MQRGASPWLISCRPTWKLRSAVPAPICIWPRTTTFARWSMAGCPAGCGATAAQPDQGWLLGRLRPAPVAGRGRRARPGTAGRAARADEDPSGAWHRPTRGGPCGARRSARDLACTAVDRARAPDPGRRSGLNANRCRLRRGRPGADDAQGIKVRLFVRGATRSLRETLGRRAWMHPE